LHALPKCFFIISLDFSFSFWLNLFKICFISFTCLRDSFEELNEKSFEKHHYSLVGKVSGRSIGFKLWAFIVGRNNNTSSLAAKVLYLL
jgi:hypothetical protein